MVVIDFHPFLCQSTHEPNVMVVTFVKLMEIDWVDDLGLVGSLSELAQGGVEHHLGQLSETRAFGNLSRAPTNPFRAS